MQLSAVVAAVLAAVAASAGQNGGVVMLNAPNSRVQHMLAAHRAERHRVHAGKTAATGGDEAEEEEVEEDPDYPADDAKFALACSREEFNRYKTILCTEELQECSSEWCQAHKHEWVKKFGACNKNGCPPAAGGGGE